MLLKVSFRITIVPFVITRELFTLFLVAMKFALKIALAWQLETALLAFEPAAFKGL